MGAVKARLDKKVSELEQHVLLYTVIDTLSRSMVLRTAVLTASRAKRVSPSSSSRYHQSHRDGAVPRFPLPSTSSPRRPLRPKASITNMSISGRLSWAKQLDGSHPQSSATVSVGGKGLTGDCIGDNHDQRDNTRERSIPPSCSPPTRVQDSRAEYQSTETQLHHHTPLHTVQPSLTHRNYESNICTLPTHSLHLPSTF